MICARHLVPVALAAIVLSACQMFSEGPSPVGGGRPARASGSQMDGTWASTDGVFVATFQGGSFTSRFTQTNEILAQGSYSVAGPDISMQWLSVATQQQRSANCSFRSTNRVHCQQAGGGSFDLTRGA
jgi:hypothetical protein